MAAKKFFHFESVGSTAVVELLKAVNDLAEADMMEELDRLLDEIKVTGSKNLLVDFENITYFGSSVLETLRLLWNQINEQGGQLVLCCVSDVGDEILSVSKFDTLWPTYPSREAALETFSEGH